MFKIYKISCIWRPGQTFLPFVTATGFFPSKDVNSVSGHRLTLWDLCSPFVENEMRDSASQQLTSCFAPEYILVFISACLLCHSIPGSSPYLCPLTIHLPPFASISSSVKQEACFALSATEIFSIHLVQRRESDFFIPSQCICVQANIPAVSSG